MSTNYAVLGLAMVAAGVLTDMIGAREVWLGAAVIYLVGAVVALVLTRWLPVITGEEDEVIDAHAEAAASALAPVAAFSPDPVRPEPEPDGSARSGLERIATLLEEIEQRREMEARRSTS